MNMTVSRIKAVFPDSSQNVWNIVTSLKNYEWRSDLSKIDIVSETQFTEYTKGGYATVFTVTAFEPCRRWEFDMENGNMIGHWTGIFKETGGQTEIDFTEEVTAKKFFLKPFVKIFLKKQQKTYVSDLKRAIERRMQKKL